MVYPVPRVYVEDVADEVRVAVAGGPQHVHGAGGLELLHEDRDNNATISRHRSPPPQKKKEALNCFKGLKNMILHGLVTGSEHTWTPTKFQQGGGQDFFLQGGELQQRLGEGDYF